MSDTAGHTHSIEHLLKLSSSRTAAVGLNHVEHIYPAQASLLDYMSCFWRLLFHCFIGCPLSFKVWFEGMHITIYMYQNFSGYCFTKLFQK